MSDPKVVDQLVREVLARLSPESIWEMAQGCRTVSVQEDGQHIRYIVECGATRLGVHADSPVEADLAQYIDHTLLKANATQEAIEQLCHEAREYGFASVCINPTWVGLASRLLSGSKVAVCTVVGFPLGANTSDVKQYETRRAIFDGAREIDMVINVGALKSGRDQQVGKDIEAVVTACHEQDAICKVILENAYLTDEEKVRAATLSKEAGADFVKTSTGFGPSGATAEDVKLMRRVVGPQIGVKAAGGISDASDTRDMIDAGATRIGASAGIKIVRGETATSSGY